MSELEVELQALGEFQLDGTFKIPAKGVTALFGRSGSGKTTVLRAMAGLSKAARGLVRINSETWQNPAVELITANLR